MNYGSEPADQVVRYSLEGAEFALRISGTAAKNFFIFAQAVLHDRPAVDFPLGSENASPSAPPTDSTISFAPAPSPRAYLARTKGERPSVRMELRDITAYLRNRAEVPKDRMPKLPVKIRRKEKVL